MVKLTVRHANDETEELELIRGPFFPEELTSDQLDTLFESVNERLEAAPEDPGLLELRAELAGQRFGFQEQVADYTAAIEALSKSTVATAAADLMRLYRRRGDTYVALKDWQAAADDYAQVITDETSDEEVLASQALAVAEVLLEPTGWTVLPPVSAESDLGATLSILPDHSILASGENHLNDRYRVVFALPQDIELAAVRLEALSDPSLPENGPGRYPNRGTFAQTTWAVTVTSPDGNGATSLQFDEAWADHELEEYPITTIGRWNIEGGQGNDCTAVWSLADVVSFTAGSTLTVETQFKSFQENSENLGRFRLSLTDDSDAIQNQQNRNAAGEIADPWQKLAAAHRLHDDQQAIDQLLAGHPHLAGPVGNLSAAADDWERAIAIYSHGITDETTDVDLLSARALAYEHAEDWDAAAADWTRAAASSTAGATFLAEFAKRLGEQDETQRAIDQYRHSQQIVEQALRAQSRQPRCRGRTGRRPSETITLEQQLEWGRPRADRPAVSRRGDAERSGGWFHTGQRHKPRF